MALFEIAPGSIAGFLLFSFVGFVGMVVHWIKRCLREESKSSLIEYLLVHRSYTLMSIMTYLGAMGALVATGIVDFTSSQSLGLAFTTGYMIDSAVNKDKDR